MCSLISHFRSSDTGNHILWKNVYIRDFHSSYSPDWHICLLYRVGKYDFEVNQSSRYEKISDHPDPIFPTNSIMEVKVRKDSAKENENCLLLQLHALQYRMDNLTNLMRYWSPSSQASVLWLESITIVRNFLKGRSNLLSDSALLKLKVAINAKKVNW